MWWVWAIVVVAVLLAILWILSRGRPAPDRQAVRDHRRGGGGDGSAGPQGGAGGAIGI